MFYTMRIFLLATILFSPFLQVEAATGILTCNGLDCNFCDAISMTNIIVEWVIGISLLLAVILLVVAGFRLITSGGDRSAYESSKKLLYNALIGFMLILAAWTIVDTFLKLIATDEAQDAAFGVWNDVECGTMYNQQTGLPVIIQLDDGPGLQDLLDEREFNCGSPGVSREDLELVGCQISQCQGLPCPEWCRVNHGLDAVFRTGNELGDTTNLRYCVYPPPPLPVDPTEPPIIPGGSGPLTGSVSPVPESQMVSLRGIGVVVANWEGINGPGRTDLVHPSVAAAVLWMQQEGLRLYGHQPFQVTAAFTHGVGHSAGSQHYTGLAVDFDAINGTTNAQLTALARAAGFTFVLDEGNHVHGDAR